MKKIFLTIFILFNIVSYSQEKPFAWFKPSTKTVPYNIVVDGNSLTLGTGATSYASIIDDSLNANYLITNKGTAGMTIESMDIRYSSVISPLYKAKSTKNILFYWEGTNQFLTGSDTATICGYFRSYYSKAKSTGWYVILLTALPQYYAGGDAGVETKRIQVNKTIRDNRSLYCDALLDIASDTLIGDKTDENDLTHYWDKVHITTAVHYLISFYALTSIQGLVQGYQPETYDWAKRVLSNSGSYTTQMLRAQDTIVLLNHINNVRQLKLRLNTFCGDSLDACLVPLYRGIGFGGTVYGDTTDKVVNFTNADYSVTGGLGATNNTNKYLNTGFNTLSCPLITVYDYSQALYQLGTGLESGVSMGNYGGPSSRNYLWTNYNTGSTYLAVMGAGESNKAHGSVSKGLWFDNRLNNTCQKYFNAVDFVMGNINGATAKPNLNIYVFCFNSSDSPSTYYIHKSGGYEIGLKHTATQVTYTTNAWNGNILIMGR